MVTLAHAARPATSVPPMTRTNRASGAPLYAAVGIALLALFVAATTTAFAAGLAANSVGAKQLKKNAVTAKKIKNNAVTGPKIKNDAVTTAKIKKGAVTADRIAAGAVPAKTVHVARTMSLGPNEEVLATVGGVVFEAACKVAVQDFVVLTMTKAGGGNIGYSGTMSTESTSSESTAPALNTSTEDLEILNQATVGDGFSITTFDGVVTPVGGKPVLVQTTTRVVDDVPSPCTLRITATPLV